MRIALGEMFDPQWIPGEKVALYAVKMRWLKLDEVTGKLEISNVGEALLDGLELTESSSTAGARVYTSTPERPVAVSQLVALMQESNSETYIDPFLDAEHVEFLLTKTTIVKILTSEKHRVAIQARLAEIEINHDYQVRVIGDKSLHDRAILHEGGGVAIVGTSFKRIESKYVVVVDLPASVSRPFREMMDALWERSELILPAHPDATRG